MAVDAFLKLDGITGESKDSVHAGEIEVMSYSWGMSNSGSTHSGPGGGSGKVNVSDLSLSKFVDKSTATLMSKCCDGSHIATGKLTLRKAGGNSPVEYLTVEMSEILVSSIQTGGSTGDDRQIEQLSLNFA